MTARALLRWLHSRCEFVYHESPNLDWMHALRALADRMDAEWAAATADTYIDEAVVKSELLARLDAPL
jgi:hypothetical protein